MASNGDGRVAAVIDMALAGPAGAAEGGSSQVIDMLAHNPRLVGALGRAVESHDLPTYIHSMRVSTIAVRLAVAVGVWTLT